MPRRAPTAGHASFFFLGLLDPAEFANFNVQNLPLRDRGATLELMGRGIAIWWPSRPRVEFVDLADGARAWFRTIAAAYYLETAVALEVGLANWVEALDVDVRKAVIGVADARFAKVAAPPEDAPVNVAMREAAELAGRLRRRRTGQPERAELERASHEALAAANDPTAQGLLSAFRALECLRRTYDPNYDRRKQAWAAMHRDLRLDEELYGVLREAAEAIRHGDVPTRQKARHPVNRARRQREALRDFTRAAVRSAIEHRLK